MSSTPEAPMEPLAPNDPADELVEEEDLVEEEVIEEEEVAQNEDEEGAAADAGELGVELDGSFQGEVANNQEINTSSFEELKLDSQVTDSAQEAWRVFIQGASSREAAGEAIYGALFDSAPSLQSLFTTPRAVQAMRFMNGLNGFITAINQPAALKVLVETLGFGHLNLEVTVPRVVIFRDAILDLLQVELGERLTTQAYTGWKALLNYVGGAIIFIKAHYSERLRLLDESWKIANDNSTNSEKFGASKEEVASGKNDKGGKGKDAKTEDPGEEKTGNQAQKVPTTYPEMFMFNAAVMGYGTSTWMPEVLACFDTIVKNVANSGRLQEECDVLVLRISKVAKGKVNLAEYKSCMLASLRSLLPKDWTTNHEVAWCWLWENVERLILKTMGSPPVWEAAYGKFVNSLDEAQAYEFRAAVYAKFFSLAPSGEDFFKQSNAYLHIIAIKIMGMVLDMYREPVRMTDDISALGLRHVGYAIPTEFFAPFVTAVIEVLRSVTDNTDVIESTRWSLGLIAKSLVRTILEGSTIVMKAINMNTKASINKAIACAPRGERNQWMLIVAVGTQNISPLAWSIEGGKLDAASAIIKDLTTFRADRDRYYYGQDELFKRHPDIVKKLCDDAPALLPELLEGLIWRSRLTINGHRRVNYYLKHLLVDPDTKFHQTMEWIAKLTDPKLVCHPCLVLLMDMTWGQCASWAFLFRKSWFLFTLVIFIISQSILEHSHFLPSEVEHFAIFGCRCFIYILSMGQMIYKNIGMFVNAYRSGDTFRLGNVIPLPNYLRNWQDSAFLILTFFLLVMLCNEPILYCIGHETEISDTSGSSGGSGRLLAGGPAASGSSSGGASAGSVAFVQFTEACDQAAGLRKFPYSTFSMLAMCLYYILLIDLAVFSTRFSSYVLACGRMVSEVSLFLLALIVVVLTFSCGFSCYDQENKEFHGIHMGALALWELMLGMFSEEHYEQLHNNAVILYGIYGYLIVSVVFLVNMLIAQLSCSYGSTYLDMIGFARLRRMKLIVETMASLSDKRWERFRTSLEFEKKLEFNEGDIGLAGGVQTTEPASANPTTVDMIQRFGGSTSPTVQWPVLETGDDDADRCDRMEKVIQKAIARLAQGGGSKRGKAASSAGGPTGSLGAGSEGEGGEGDEMAEEGSGAEDLAEE